MSKWRRNLSLHKRWVRNHLVNKYGNTCYLCGEPFKKMRDITLDHLVPRSKGGQTVIENLRLAHEHCNFAKADMTAEEYAELQEKGL